MRIMIDTNVLVSAFILNSQHILKMIDEITISHTIVLNTYIIDELKRITLKKFPNKYDAVEQFLIELPYQLVYSSDKISLSNYPHIRDIKDLPILASAIDENVEILITGDNDLTVLKLKHPEILTSREFTNKYCK